jgi:CheY-like chemotaxis protein
VTGGLPSRMVLIVDDEPDVVFVLKTALEKGGYRTESAAGGAEALTKAVAVRPDAIILDIMMPGMDGLEVNWRLKRDPATRDVPVFIMTGKGRVEEVLDLRERASIAAYLEKPFPVARLLQKLKEVLV